jgi:hypothetical protein
VQIDSYDSWSADWTIAQVAVPLLQQLQTQKQGAPFTNDEDVPDYLKSTSCAPKENEWDTDENHFKRWEYILDEMVFAMQEIANNNENEPPAYKKVSDMVCEENEDGTFTMVTSGLERIPEMEVVNREYHERIKNGCRLFGVYFQCLWS